MKANDVIEIAKKYDNGEIWWSDFHKHYVQYNVVAWDDKTVQERIDEFDNNPWHGYTFDESMKRDEEGTLRDLNLLEIIPAYKHYKVELFDDVDSHTYRRIEASSKEEAIKKAFEKRYHATGRKIEGTTAKYQLYKYDKRQRVSYPLAVCEAWATALDK